MEPKHVVGALIRRLGTLVAFGALGLLAAVVVTGLTPPQYASRTDLLFTVAQGDGAAAVLQGAQYSERTVTSLVELARSPSVLAPVIADLDLGLTSSELARSLIVDVPDDSTILRITATGASPSQAAAIADGVSDQVQRVASDLSLGAVDVPGALTATTIRAAEEPTFRSSPSLMRNGLAGGILGVLLGVLVALVRESVDARVSGPRDLASLTTLPVWRVRMPRPSRRIASRWTERRAGRAEDAMSQDLGKLRLALAGSTATSMVRSIRVARSGESASTSTLGSELADAFGASVTEDIAPQPPRISFGRRGTEPVLLELTGAPAAASTGSSSVLGNGAPTLLVVEQDRTLRSAVQATLTDGGDSDTRRAGIVLTTKYVGGPRLLTRLLGRLRDPNRASTGSDPGEPPVVAGSTILIALVAIVAAGMNYGLPLGLNTAFVAAAALSPFWLGELRRYRWATVLFALAVLALGYGFLLADWSAADHAIDGRIAAETSFRFLGAFATMGLILWARRFLSLMWIGAAYGSGALLVGLSQVPGSPNPWKFQLAFGATVVFLSLVSTRRRRIAPIGALVVLGLVSVALDFRSWFAFCAVAAALLVWQARPRAVDSRPTPRFIALILVAALGLASYALASFAIVGGYLGDELQQRSVAQIQASGSLIAGGRPEWTVTWVLMQERPMGFGIGVVPNSFDVLAGGKGFDTVNVPFQPGYVEFLFGGQFKLHSVTADLWSLFGVLGLILAAAILFVILSALSISVTIRLGNALTLFLLVANLWNLVFQPIYSSLPSLALLLGLVLLPSRRPPDAPITASVSPSEADRARAA